jgi:3-phosphoshikimate 1-carboxyvinyltransferase
LTFPDRLEIIPLNHPPSASVEVPGSKSITNRALVLAALAEPFESSSSSVLNNVLKSEDTEVMVESLRRLGIPVQTDWENDRLVVPCVPRSEWAREAEFFCGNSGTTMRFLTAMVALGQGRYRLDGVARMRERPIEDLLDALRQLGVNAFSEKGNGCPPVVVQTNGFQGGSVRIRGGTSSQFLSGLLMVSPLATGPRIHLRVDGELVSQPYVDMTVNLMRRSGVFVTVESPEHLAIPTEQSYRAEDYSIEPDASAASYFFGAAAIAGGQVTVLGFPVNKLQSLQGDVRFVDILADMGCRVERCSSGVTVHGRPLHGIDVDMNDISDTVMTLAAVACFAEGTTTIRNVAHIRHKETDRLAALAAELRRVGAGVEEFADGLTITPRPLHGAEIETYNDHRMAMSMALIGLRVPGIIIKNPGCVAKTYPHFFDDLEKLR